MESDKAVAFLNLGMMALRNGHDVEAVRSFRSALALRTDIVEAYIGLALAHSRMNEYAEMVEAFQKSIEINTAAVRQWAKSSIPGPHNWLSFSPEYAHITGKMAEFLHTQDEADALTRLGASHIANGYYKAAVEALEYCLTRVRDYEAAIVLLTVAYLLLGANDEDEAAKLRQSSILKKIVPKLATLLLGS
jgi:tetratricopeptide (TPR) repeat protein